MSMAIGIDLGTSKFGGAVCFSSDCYLVADEWYSVRIPSVSAADPSGTWLIGERARRRAPQLLHNTIHNIKQIVGKSYCENITYEIVSRCRYVIGCYDKDKPIVQIVTQNGTIPIRPEDIQSFFISYIKMLAQLQFGKEVHSAVVSVPAHFNNKQRRATVDACSLADLKVLRLINEPTAIALGFHYYRYLISDGTSNLLVFDMGYSLKITIITLDIRDKVPEFKIRATVNDEFFGGNDFSDAMYTYIVDFVREHYNQDFEIDLNQIVTLEEMIENAKISLSHANDITLEIEDGGDRHLVNVTRRLFENLCRKLVLKARSYIDKIFMKAWMEKQDIKKIIVTGGACKMPMLKKMIFEYFNGKLRVNEPSDSMVAAGAAVQAAMLTGQTLGQARDLLPVDVLPNSLGVNCHRDFVIVVKKGTKLPCAACVHLKLTCQDPMSTLIYIFEGECQVAFKNKYLGSILAPEMTSGQFLMVQLTFEVDKYCIVNVTMKVVIGNVGTVIQKKFYANAPKISLNDMCEPSSSKD